MSDGHLDRHCARWSCVFSPDPLQRQASNCNCNVLRGSRRASHTRCSTVHPQVGAGEPLAAAAGAASEAGQLQASAAAETPAPPAEADDQQHSAAAAAAEAAPAAAAAADAGQLQAAAADEASEPTLALPADDQRPVARVPAAKYSRIRWGPVRRTSAGLTGIRWFCRPQRWAARSPAAQDSHIRWVDPPAH